jgi:hypothetical protein
MNFARLKWPVLSAAATLLISGAGIAFAGNGSPAVSGPASTVAAPLVAPAAPAAVPAAPTAEPTTEATTEPTTEPAEAAGTEAAGAEEPGDANLPGGGHADNPNDPNADHQFEGVE